MGAPNYFSESSEMESSGNEKAPKIPKEPNLAKPFEPVALRPTGQYPPKLE